MKFASAFGRRAWELRGPLPGTSSPFAFRYAGYDLAVDFARGQYASGGAAVAGLSALPGYAYTRAGTALGLTSQTALTPIAANAPIITDRGLLATGQLTNTILYSQGLDSVWGGGGGQPATVTPNNAVAPDGTMTADTVTIGGLASSYLAQTVNNPVSGGVVTGVVYVRKPATGGATAVRWTTNNTSAWSTGITKKLVLTSAWQPLVLSGTMSAGGAIQIMLGNVMVDGSMDPDCVGNVEVWQAQVIKAGTGAGAIWSDSPDGVPLIGTASATASLGAGKLDVNLGVTYSEDCFFILDAEVTTQTPWAGVTGACLYDAGGTNRMTLYQFGSTWYAEYIVGGAWTGEVTVPSVLGRNRIGYRRRAGAITIFAFNGGTHSKSAETAIAAPATTLSKVAFGCGHNGSNPMWSNIRAGLLRKGSFTDAQCQAMLEAL